LTAACGERPQVFLFAPRVDLLCGQEALMDFHPTVYKIVAALAVWFVLGAWIFAGGGATDFLLVIVSGVFLVTLGIPTLLTLTGRGRQGRRERESAIQFGDWASREVHILTGPVKGIFATVETILPIAAVALGMTLFGLVAHFAGR
jgi:hypothetical protein